MIISCIIPYFNEEENIIYTLNQLVNQTYKSKEIIFINSNSYDNSPKIVKNFISNVDLNIKNFDTNIQSASEAKNFGIEKSNFEWLAFMDCDMFFDEFWLEKQVTFANRFPKKSIFFGNTLLNGTNIIDKCCAINTYGLDKLNPTIPSSLIKKSVFDDYNNYFLQSKSHYDSYWIKKNLNSERSIINHDLVIGYINTNYASSYHNVFKKSLYYSKSLKEVYPIKVYISLFGLVIVVSLSLIYLKLLPYLFILYVVFKIILIPIYKNKTLKIYKKIKYNLLSLLYTSFLLDIGRITGIVLSLFNKNNNVINHYKNK